MESFLVVVNINNYLTNMFKNLIKIQIVTQDYFSHKMKVLILGAYGQVGVQLIRGLSARIKPENIFCSDLREPPSNLQVKNHLRLDALDAKSIQQAIQKNNITQIYSLAALLSASGEKDPLSTQYINMQSLFVTLQAARKYKLDKVFWPSSIAAFGPDTPKNTPQQTIMNPSTVYGITKKAGELWCAYYYSKYGVDVRSVRYPGLVGYRSLPGGGTTDYAVDIFHKALKKQTYQCYLAPQTQLPMIYTDDAVKGTLDLMFAPRQCIRIRTSYNFGGFSFCPRQIAAQIQKHIPDFKIEYKIDPIRQRIASSWPHKILDDEARRDWGWKPEHDLASMTKIIIDNLQPV